MKKGFVQLYYFIVVFCVFWLGVLFYLGYFGGNYKIVTLFSFIFVSLFMYIVIKSCKFQKIYFTLTVLIYTLFTQFGLCYVYYLINNDIIDDYGGEMYYWLSSSYYPQVMGCALIAIAMIMIGSSVGNLIGTRIKITVKCKRVSKVSSEIKNRITTNIGIILLVFALTYFTYYLSTGAYSIGMDYTDLHSNIIMTNPLWEYVIILYGFGLCCIVCCGKGKSLFVGICIFGITAVILLLMGNRGEVLFPLLAAIGVFFYKQNKIDKRWIIVGVVIVLVVIPIVKVFRHLGDGNLIELYVKASPLSGIAEMGVSMRMTNYIIRELNDGTRHLLYGFSYINPIVNILDHFIPGDIRLTAPSYFNFRDSFYLWKAMTPVAESYANFGLVGVIIYHFIMGAILGCAERKQPTGNRLTLLACITFIFIYSTRNVFANVPLYCLLAWILYLVIDVISKIIVICCEDKK